MATRLRASPEVFDSTKTFVALENTGSIPVGRRKSLKPNPSAIGRRSHE